MEKGRLELRLRDVAATRARIEARIARTDKSDPKLPALKRRVKELAAHEGVLSERMAALSAKISKVTKH